MSALVGALLVAAGLLCLALTYLVFRRPQPPSITQNDDFGSFVAVVLTAIVALGAALLVDSLSGAPYWQVATGMVAIAAAVVVLAAVIMRGAGAAPSESTFPSMPPPLPVKPHRPAGSSTPRKSRAPRRKAA